MADWYVSSANYAAVAQWAASTAYTVGQFIRPLTPQTNQLMVFRCTTAGTTGATEPTQSAWGGANGNNATITSGTATFTNVTGQSTYGWSAAAGSVYAITPGANSSRPVPGDRVFAASDHSESFTAGVTYSFNNNVAAYGQVQIISVNRAGSVPPVAADVQSGASITLTNAGLVHEPVCGMYWQGFTFTIAGTSSAGVQFGSSNSKTEYFKNCAFVVTNNHANSRLQVVNAPQKIVFDNTTVQFGNVGQSISSQGYSLDLLWLNTPSAIVGATLPTTLFTVSTGSSALLVTCRGVDFSAYNGTFIAGSALERILLDSCRINPAATRYGVPGANWPSGDEIELVNSFDGTNYLNERYTPAGAVTTDRGLTLSGGAQDDVGSYSLKLVSSTRSDKQSLPLDSFWLDVENTLVGSARTASIEIISLGTLNNDDIRLFLEYMGTAGSAVASFADSLASVLTTTVALTSSSATWSGSPPAPLNAWNPLDTLNVTLSNNNLTLTGAGAGGARPNFNFTTGKYYWECTFPVWGSNNTSCGLASSTTNFSTAASAATGAVMALKDGNIYVNGTNTGVALGARSAGNIIGVAVDVASKLIWYRVAPSGNWNGSGTANPATGVGGVSYSFLSGATYPLGITNTSGDQVVANFGASAFSGSIPSGFSAPPAQASPTTFKQFLQVTFTPQMAGRVRGLVRLSKVSTTVWINPQIAIT